MRNSQRISVNLSEIREKINGLPDDATKETIDGLTGEYQTLESRYRAALISEDAEDSQSGNEEATPEAREIQNLAHRARILDYAMEAIDGSKVDGASLELRQAVLGSDLAGYMPLEMLEHRADAVSNVANAIERGQQPIAARVFAQSSLNYLGVMSPTVPVGTTSYPRLNAGHDCRRSERRRRTGRHRGNPDHRRNQPGAADGKLHLRRETLSKISGFEEALRQDVQAVWKIKGRPGNPGSIRSCEHQPRRGRHHLGVDQPH